MIEQFAAMLYLGRRYPRSPGYLREAGEALLALKEAGEDWLAIAKVHGLSRSRAYELLVLGSRNKTQDQIRAETAARVRKHRKDRWLPTRPPHQKRPKGPKLSVTERSNHGQSTEVRLPRGGVEKVRHERHARKP